MSPPSFGGKVQYRLARPGQVRLLLNRVRVVDISPQSGDGDYLGRLDPLSRTAGLDGQTYAGVPVLVRMYPDKPVYPGKVTETGGPFGLESPYLDPPADGLAPHRSKEHVGGHHNAFRSAGEAQGEKSRLYA